METIDALNAAIRALMLGSSGKPKAMDVNPKDIADMERALLKSAVYSSDPTGEATLGRMQPGAVMNYSGISIFPADVARGEFRPR